ncbi:thermonuclease family protein [Candidatus Phaeomarinobacter ectocarpi]|uniref:thermonuclease family protein n=1 Tax=Candidatus Phaeomarinibacter ectocarpi TaxID=1458461 RepID=UPI0009DE3520|nr:thermonuclease family protein [Candidatus Phaeomarinobacter ectocarpi]
MKRQVSLFGAVILGVLAVGSILLGEEGTDTGVGTATAPIPSGGEASGCAVPPSDASRAFDVIEVVDGDTIVLDDRSEVRMVGIQAPKLPLGRRNFPEWPLAKEARDLAVDIASRRDVVLWSGGSDEDRHGRRLAHTYVRDGQGGTIWFQGEMLRRGLARVYTFPDNRACVADLLAQEAAAREEGLGMWGLDTYRIVNANELDRLNSREGSYELIEGRVREAKNINGRVYLNFGTNYRDDFTVTISPRDMKLFRDAGIDPTDYEGRIVRARGWVRLFNGPSIDATHPEQIEVLR